jgi:hypothetical protein
MGAMARVALCGVVGGAAALAVFAASSPTERQSALLRVLSPQVTLARANTVESVPFERVIRSGDTVRTDARGRALVTYPDGSTATLDGSSELTIEFVRTSAGDYLVRMEQTIGRVWYAAARTIGSGGRYEVRSTAMASVIRAGSGSYVAVSEDGATSIIATTGTVDATAGGATVTLPAGASTTVSAPGQTPAPTQVVGAGPQVAPSPVADEMPSLAVVMPSDAADGAAPDPRGSGSTVSAPIAAQAPAAPHQTNVAPPAAPAAATPVPVPYVPTSLIAPETREKPVGEKPATEQTTTTKTTATTEKTTTATTEKTTTTATDKTTAASTAEKTAATDTAVRTASSEVGKTTEGSAKDGSTPTRESSERGTKGKDAEKGEGR